MKTDSLRRMLFQVQLSALARRRRSSLHPVFNPTGRIQPHHNGQRKVRQQVRVVHGMHMQGWDRKGLHFLCRLLVTYQHAVHVQLICTACIADLAASVAIEPAVPCTRWHFLSLCRCPAFARVVNAL